MTYREDPGSWSRGHELALSIHQATAALAGRERGPLAVQLRRLARSIPRVLSTAGASVRDVDRAPRVADARARCAALEYWLVLAQELRWLDDERIERLWQQAVRLGRWLGERRDELEREMTVPEVSPVEVTVPAVRLVARRGAGRAAAPSEHRRPLAELRTLSVTTDMIIGSSGLP